MGIAIAVALFVLVILGGASVFFVLLVAEALAEEGRAIEERAEFGARRYDAISRD